MPDPATLPATPTSPNPGRTCAVAFAAAGLAAIPLAWLLARVVWLWYYSGLFGYLVAGLLIGGLAFRIARAARPISARRLLAGTLLVTLFAWTAALFFESRHVAATIGGHPRFPRVRESVLAAGGTGVDVTREAADAFRRALADRYPPGGLLGYVRWATDSGELDLALRDSTEHLSIGHRRYSWLARTIVALLLLVAGAWSGVESLRSSTPVSNILPPGAEYEPAE